MLEKSQEDEEILALAERIVAYHKDFELNPVIVRQNGILRAIYHYYIADKNACILTLKNAPLTEIYELEKRISAIDMFLVELSKLIIDEEKARSNLIELKELEQMLTQKEVTLIKRKYFPSFNETELKR